MTVLEAAKTLRDEMDRQSRLMPHMNWNRTDFEKELGNLLKRAIRLDEMQSSSLRQAVLEKERGND